MVGLLLMVTEMLYHMPHFDANYDQISITATTIWLMLEEVFWVSVVFSNILFLAIRSCTRHKIQLDKVPQRL